MIRQRLSTPKMGEPIVGVVSLWVLLALRLLSSTRLARRKPCALSFFLFFWSDRAWRGPLL